MEILPLSMKRYVSTVGLSPSLILTEVSAYSLTCGSPLTLTVTVYHLYVYGTEEGTGPYKETSFWHGPIMEGSVGQGLGEKAVFKYS